MAARGTEQAGPSFGAELRRWREYRGLSLRQLAERVCYTFSYLAKLETGSKPPVVEVAETCDRVLGTGRELVELAVAQSRLVSVGRGWRDRPNCLRPCPTSSGGMPSWSS